MKNSVRNIGKTLLGILILVFALGLMGLCQFARGEARPFVPKPIQWIIFSGDSQVVVEEYFYSVADALEKFPHDSEECKQRNDLKCLTQTFENLRDDIGQRVPAEASWMSDAHKRLYEAVAHMAELSKRSETEQITLSSYYELSQALDEVIIAKEDWTEQSER